MQSTIGDRIQIIIDDKNLKKVEFARTLNIDQSYVTQLIKGRNNPSERLLEDICQKFSVNKTWLCTGSGSMYIPTNDFIVNDPSLDAADREILSSYLRMTPAQRQFIKSWIKDIAASISQADQEDDKRAKVHRILDQELDAEKETASDSTAGLSGTGKV